MSNALNIILNQGEDFARVITIKDPPTPGTLRDLTGYTFRGQGRLKYDSPTAAFTFSFALRPQTGGTLGQVDWALANSVLVPLVLTKPAIYFYDVEMVSPTGFVTRILEGQATVRPEVTK